MRQYVGHYNQQIGGGNRFVTALVTECEHDLVLVYIDEWVVMQTVPKTEYKYFIVNDQADIDHAKAAFRDAANRLGFDPAVEAYIGRVQRDQPASFEDLILEPEEEDIFS